MKLTGFLMALLATAAMLTAVGPAPAHADAYNIRISVLTPPGATGIGVLDVAHYSEADRGRVHLWSYRTTGEVRNQRWNVTKLYTVNGHDVFRIVNVKSGKCLDKSEDVPNANGNAVYQYTCRSTANQEWEFIPGPDSQWRWGQLKNRAAGRCLDIQGPSFTEGATIHVWDCYSTWSQRWNPF